MRELGHLEAWRIRDSKLLNPWGLVGDKTCGAFRIPYQAVEFLCVASREGGWDHVSVSTAHRCPRWGEMDHIKRLFFAEDETAMQLHVPVVQHINNHPYCLHLWRPQQARIPMPPAEFV